MILRPGQRSTDHVTGRQPAHIIVKNKPIGAASGTKRAKMGNMNDEEENEPVDKVSGQKNQSSPPSQRLNLADFSELTIKLSSVAG